MPETNAIQAAYERFKLEWMLAHGYTLKNLIDELEQLRKESPELSLESIFHDWEFEYCVAIWKMLRKKGCVPSALTQNVKVRPDRALCKAV